jgi:hypothetical protein
LTAPGNNHCDCCRRCLSRQISAVPGRSLPHPGETFKPSRFGPKYENH